jgi:hypothetical protein
MGKYESTPSDTIIEQLRRRKTYLNTTEVMCITVARWLEARQV